MTDEHGRRFCETHQAMERKMDRMDGLAARVERMLNGNGQPSLDVRLTQIEDRQMNIEARHGELMRIIEQNTAARRENSRTMWEVVLNAVLPAALTLGGLLAYKLIVIGG